MAVFHILCPYGRILVMGSRLSTLSIDRSFNEAELAPELKEEYDWLTAESKLINCHIA